ncbi:hypothetical protein [Nonomuraea sp. NPDC050786]|uniref:hypothetical protein n=1 Tax=Nonomuraea sp. NPDC050786 TaxID=3154840 RepID=UPI00340A84EF
MSMAKGDKGVSKASHADRRLRAGYRDLPARSWGQRGYAWRGGQADLLPPQAEFETFRTPAEQGLSAVGDDPARRRRLELMRDMYAFMMDRFPGLLDE